MATSGRSALLSSTSTGPKSTLEHSNPEEDDGQDLWSTILSEVSTHSRSKLPSGKNVLVMGEVGSGKTTLVAKLQGVEEYMKGRGLEYLYFNVHDDDIDDHTRCNAWVLDGDLYHKGLQGVAVPVDSVSNTLLLVTVDMSRPWNALDSLQKWAAVAREHIDKLRLTPETLRELEHRLVKQFQEYTEPGSGEDGTPQRRSEDEESVLLPLGDNTLTHNLGIPVVVVCTKCDAISTLEKEHDYRDEHLDFIQSHIRRFCLQYGASLVYTSVKEMKNLDILYKYLVHRLYGFPFHCLAQVVERDAVFIPSGWDNEKKIAILHENFQTVKADDSFEDVVVKPPVRKIVHEKEIQAEDDQVFLVKLQSLLAKQPAVTAGRPVDTTSRAPTGSPRTSNRSAAANVANAMPQSGQTSEGVLANFFNSLLTKKAGTGGPGTPGGGNNTPGTVRKSDTNTSRGKERHERARVQSWAWATYRRSWTAYPAGRPTQTCPIPTRRRPPTDRTHEDQHNSIPFSFSPFFLLLLLHLSHLPPPVSFPPPLSPSTPSQRCREKEGCWGGKAEVDTKFCLPVVFHFLLKEKSSPSLPPFSPTAPHPPLLFSSPAVMLRTSVCHCYIQDCLLHKSKCVRGPLQVRRLGWSERRVEKD